MARKTDWSKVPFGTEVRAWDDKDKVVGRFLYYDKEDEESPFLVFLEFVSRAYWFDHCELIKEVI